MVAERTIEKIYWPRKFAHVTDLPQRDAVEDTCTHMSRTRRPLVLCSVMAVLLTATVGTGQQPAPIFLGALRQDAALVPIAIYDGREWWNRWPWDTEGNRAEPLRIPADVKSIPADWLPPAIRLPDQWLLYRRSGPAVRVRTDRPVKPSAWDLMDTVGLHSDYRVRAADKERLYDSDEIGIAISGPATGGRFTTTPSAESQRIVSALSGRLATLEKDALDRWSTRRREADPAVVTPKLTAASPAGDTKSKPPFRLMKASRPFNGRSYYFLTGEKLYAFGTDDCRLNVSFEGVAVQETSGRVRSEGISAAATAEFCGDRTEWTTPLLTVEWADQLIWVVKHGVEDGYDYRLFDPDRNRSVPLRGQDVTASAR